MILKNLVVVVGEYEKDGETKKNYLRIGQLHEGKNGEYITIDAHVNLAAIPRREGDSRVMVSMYDPPSRDEKPVQARKPKPKADDFDDDIPF